MKIRQILAALTIITGTSLATWGANYTIDPVHSAAIFRIKHMNAAYVYGRINSPAGTIAYDKDKPEATTFDVTLKVDDIDTHEPNRDNHLKSPTFFNGKEFPTITFKSTAVKKIDDDHLDVTGDLTIHGVTKSVTVKMEHTGDGAMQGKSVIGFEATFDIKRSDFGMNQMIGPVGDDVRLIVSLEGDKQ